MKEKMEIIKQATNNDGDYVLFRRVRNKAVTHYQVFVYNNRTCHSMLAYNKSIMVGALCQTAYEDTAMVNGLGTFNEACNFMGIEIEEEEA